MANTIEYGIQELKLMPVNADGTFPDFDGAAGAKLINLIVMDSFQEDKDDDQETNLYVEDIDDPLLKVTGERGMRTITFQSYDLSPEQYAYFFGYVNQNGYMVETPGFVLPPQAMRLITRSIDNYQSKSREWAKLDVVVKKTGTTGKNQLPYIQFDITIPANLDANGNVVPGYQERVVEPDDFQISVTPTTLSYTVNGGSKTVTVLATKNGQPAPVEAYYSPSWLAASEPDATGKSTITAVANPTIDRADFVRFRPVGSTKYATVAIDQTGHVYEFAADTSEISAVAAGETKDISSLVSTKDGASIGWTVKSKPTWVTVDDIGTAAPKVNFAANTGGVRTGNLVFEQNESKKTLTFPLSQAAAVAPTLTGYIGVLPDVDPPTEASILALPTFAAGNQDVYHEYSANEERPAIVQPASLPSYTHAINPIGDDEIPLFKEIQMSVGGVMCKVMYPKLAFGDGLPYGWTFKK